MSSQNVLRRLRRRVLGRLEGERILRARFARFHHRSLDLSLPESFSEILYARMIATHRGENPQFTRLADKVLARDFVREKLGEQYLTPLLWSGYDPAEIPFDQLPSPCFAKTNHGSGFNLRLVAPFDREAIIETLNRWLSQNYYWSHRERQYLEIKPCILVEPMLDDGHAEGPLNYRFWCFDGAVEMIQVDTRTNTINQFYDSAWQRLLVRYRDVATELELARPKNLDEMLRVASSLAADFDFVRVDLYNIEGQIRFGELTFTPMAGRFTWKPAEWDLRLGQKWIYRRSNAGGERGALNAARSLSSRITERAAAVYALLAGLH